MLSWRPIAEQLVVSVQGDAFWEGYLEGIKGQHPLPFLIHLAVFVEPYLQFILEGKKTVESRFSTRRFVPYEHVSQGDVILLKRSGGPIVGICQVANAWFYDLDPATLSIIREQFAQAICAPDSAFWNERAHSAYASLIRIHEARSISPIEYTKRDRRGWVVLCDLPTPKQLSMDGL